MNKYSIFVFWFAVFCLSTFRVQGQVSQNDLIAYFPFDGDAKDASGLGNNGNMIGGVASGTDRFGNACGALSFDGKSGYVQVPNSSSLQKPYSEFSMTTWFYIEKANDPNMLWLTFVCKGSQPTETSSNPQYRVQVQQSKSSTISLNTEITENFNINYSQNQWYFFAMVYNGQQIKAYLNNQVVFSFNYNRKLVSNNAPLDIAHDVPGSTEYFAGRLDEMRLYSRALSESEVMALYNDQTRNQLTSTPEATTIPSVNKKNDKGKCGAMVRYKEPQFTVGCGTVSTTIVEGLVSGGTFPVGTNSVTYLGNSSMGGSKTSHFFVKIYDDEPPTIQCPKNQKVKAPAGATSNVVTYSNPVVADNCKNTTYQMLQGFPTGGDFPLGKTTVSYQAIDASGNKAECSFDVEVVAEVVAPIVVSPDPVPVPTVPVPVAPSIPAITVQVSCQSDILITVEASVNGQIVNYAQPRLIVNQVARNMALTQGFKSGVMFPVGVTQVVYQAKDDTGGVHYCKFNVTIKAKPTATVPVIICPEDIEANCETGKGYAVVYFANPLAMEGSKPLTVKQVKGLPSGSKFDKGKHEIIFEAIGLAGQKTTCSFFITINCEVPVAPPNPTVLNPGLNIGNDSIVYEPKSITTTSCIITLYGYDGREYDHDTVSIIFNDQVLVNRVEIVRNTDNYKGIIRLILQLEPNKPNTLILKAWNEGTMSTNTLMVELYEGDVSTKHTKGAKPIDKFELRAKPGYAKALVLYCK